MLRKGKTSRDNDFNLLKRLKGLAWLSNLELAGLASGLVTNNFQRHEVMLGENGLTSEAHILLSGVAKISCLNARDERVTVALVPPGPIPEFPSQLPSRWRFQCDAYSNCRFGTLGWEHFNAIAVSAPPSAFREFHQSNMRLWYRLLLRGSTFLNLNLHDRVEMALLELCQDFGIEDSRGTLLRVAFSHKDLASLVGASRPRVTEHLAQLEREQVVVRQGRQLVVRTRDLGNSKRLQAA
ncbi:MAG TPA: Crp/Fnr family transcriptional regulator [Candidatus Binataceae bacterium]|nr:Crp/Fnr family transcriptional regulator [Candidatus Binataceae bacterium]